MVTRFSAARDGGLRRAHAVPATPLPAHRARTTPATAAMHATPAARCACGGGCARCGALARPPAIARQDAGPVIRRMAALDHSDEDNVLETNKHPWPDRDPVGNDYRVQTDAGSDVRGWVAYGGVPEAHSYWCHGHSLDTYRRWGYSVYSGGGMRQAIADEYRAVAADTARAGDLAVWPQTAGGVPFGHSARITAPAVSGGALDPDRTRVSTKNGMRALDGNATLRSVMDVSVYGPGYRVYRRR